MVQMAQIDGFEHSFGLTKLVLGAAVLYYVARSVYRLYFHPLAKIPGPWVAAVSSGYEFYHDCIQAGRFHVRIDEMHERYGPIVRINPWEVHINDPAIVNTLYKNNSKLDKDPFYYGAFGVNSSSFDTIDHAAHRMRREPLGPFFSTVNVHKLHTRVLARVQQLFNRFEEFAKEDRPITVSNAYRCFAADIVTDFALPETKALLAHPDFAPNWVRSIRELSTSIIWNRHIPIIAPLLKSLPRWLVAALDRDGGITSVVDMNLDAFAQAKLVTSGHIPKDYPTVLNTLFTSPSLPLRERTIYRLASEAITFMAAGSETTGATLSHLTYHVLSNPPILARLKSELAAAAAKHNVPPGKLLDCHIVESIPYLQALMKETLRYTTPITGRLPRKNPAAATVYTTPPSSSTGRTKTYTLPPNTTISSTPRTFHLSPSIFPDPHTFSPERWLTSDAETLTRMNRFFLPFGKGDRICVGMELAKVEILSVAGNLFREFEVRLWETGREEVEFVHDFFGAWERGGGKGVRVKVRRVGREGEVQGKE